MPRSLVPWPSAATKQRTSIPKEQQDTLLEIGRWLGVNGEAIYATHAWTKFGEGGWRGEKAANVRFTVKNETLYAIVLGDWKAGDVVIKSLSTTEPVEGTIDSVAMLGRSEKLAFNRDGEGLTITLPADSTGKYARVFKIEGLKMNPPTWTKSGNPE